MALDPKKVKCWVVEITDKVHLEFVEILQAHSGIEPGMFLTISVKKMGKVPPQSVTLRENTMDEIVKHWKHSKQLQGYTMDANRRRALLDLPPIDRDELVLEMTGDPLFSGHQRYRAAREFRKHKPSSSVRSIQKCPVIRIDKPSHKRRQVSRKNSPSQQPPQPEQEE